MNENEDQVGEGSDQIFSVDCFISRDSGTRPFFAKFFLTVSLPLFWPILSFIFWGLYATCKKKRSYMKNFTPTLVILLFFSHPNIIKSTFQMFSCKYVENHWYLNADLGIQCWVTDHRLYALAVGLPSLFIWCFGIPAFALFVLWRNKKDHQKINFKYKWGFLYIGYQHKTYYWEFVILFRKIFVIFMDAFGRSLTTQVQALTVMIVILMFFYSHIKVWPFINEELNNLELISIIASGVIIYAGLYFLTGDLNNGAEMFFFLIIIFALIWFGTYWVLKGSKQYVLKFLTIIALKKPEKAEKIVQKYFKNWVAAQELIISAKADFLKKEVELEKSLYQKAMRGELCPDDDEVIQNLNKEWTKTLDQSLKPSQGDILSINKEEHESDSDQKLKEIYNDYDQQENGKYNKENEKDINDIKDKHFNSTPSQNENEEKISQEKVEEIKSSLQDSDLENIEEGVNIPAMKAQDE